MGRFGNEYLAESVGYSTGRHHGQIEGHNAGYNDGWNAAVAQATPIIESLRAEIDRLAGEVHKGNACIRDLRANLAKSQHVSELYHSERDELVELHRQEKARRERLQYLVNLAREHGIDVEAYDR